MPSLKNILIAVFLGAFLGGVALKILSPFEDKPVSPPILIEDKPLGGSPLPPPPKNLQWQSSPDKITEIIETCMDRIWGRDDFEFVSMEYKKEMGDWLVRYNTKGDKIRELNVFVNDLSGKIHSFLWDPSKMQGMSKSVHEIVHFARAGLKKSSYNLDKYKAPKVYPVTYTLSELSVVISHPSAKLLDLNI